MRDIHSIGQAFKIVSGGTAKGEVDSEGSNLSEVSVRDTKPIASQESSPQTTEKEYCLCCNQKRVLTIWNKKALCKRCLFRHKQAREEMLKEEKIFQIINEKLSRCAFFEHLNY